MGYGLWVGSKGLRDRVRVKVRGRVSVSALLQAVVHCVGLSTLNRHRVQGRYRLGRQHLAKSMQN